MKKPNWKKQALEAINKVFPKASYRTKRNLLANMAHETANGTASLERAMKWKNMESRTDLTKIKGKVNAYMKKNGLSKDQYDNLSKERRISIQYQGDVGFGLSGGIGALQTTDVGGDSIKEMRSVGLELGQKDDESIKSFVSENMYNSAIFSLSVMKAKGTTSEQLNSYKNALDLRKQLINPGETDKKRLKSVEDYEKDITTNYQQIDPDAPKPGFITNSENELSTYKQYSIELAEQRGKQFKKEITPEEYVENVRQIKTDYQKEFGNDFLKKGNNLYNKEIRENFLKLNKNGKKILELDEEFEKLTRQQEDKNSPDLTKKEQEKLKNIGGKRSAAFAEIQLESKNKKVADLQKKIDGSDFGSAEYKDLVSKRDNINVSIQEIEDGFGSKRDKDYTDVDANNSNSFGFNNKAKTFTMVQDRTSYVGKNDVTNIDDVFGKEKYVSTSILKPKKSNKTDPIDPSKKDKKNDNDDVFDFDKKLDKADFKTKDAYIFSDDDEEKKQSVKSYLKSNPMALVTAALGVKGVMDSQEEVPSMEVKDLTSLSNSFYEYLGKLEKGSKQGFSPAEEAAYNKKINDGYMASLDLAVKASGGSRAQVLSQVGSLNSNKNESLLDFASADAKLQRDNMQKYGQALEYEQSFDERKDVRRQANEYREKTADFEQAVQKRQGGAMLAAGSLKSLVDSITSYQETGEGSVLSRYTNYMVEKEKSEGMVNNPETGVAFKNAAEQDDYNKRMTEKDKEYNSMSSSFARSFSGWDATTEEKNQAKINFDSLDEEGKINAFKNNDFGNNNPLGISKVKGGNFEPVDISQASMDLTSKLQGRGIPGEELIPKEKPTKGLLEIDYSKI